MQSHSLHRRPRQTVFPHSRSRCSAPNRSTRFLAHPLTHLRHFVSTTRATPRPQSGAAGSEGGGGGAALDDAEFARLLQEQINSEMRAQDERDALVARTLYERDIRDQVRSQGRGKGRGGGLPFRCSIAWVTVTKYFYVSLLGGCCGRLLRDAPLSRVDRDCVY